MSKKLDQLSRRSFLRKAALATGGLFLVPNFISCNDDDNGTAPSGDVDGYTIKNFDHGVASFDPTSSQVIIWTRYSNASASAAIGWQVATDEAFENIVREGTFTTDASRDYTVGIEVQELSAGMKLYYRFMNEADQAISVVGETITFGTNVNEVKFAVCSCANIASGFFNVYEAMANSDADVIVHLGDYIYEYGVGEYGYNSLTDLYGRTPDPVSEIISLDDYRTRYRQYRSDNKLQLAHQKKPFIAVWDDHEITNDAWTDGAENHNDGEGSFDVRKQNALQAYSEYMPMMTNDISVIYRTFNIGNLVDLVMLDTRLIGRNEQLNYANYIDPNTGQFNIPAFQADYLDPTRTILGTTQRNWAMGQIAGSAATWQVLGQQVLMGKILIPFELIGILARVQAEIEATGQASPQTLADFQALMTVLVPLKLRYLAGDPTLTPQEIARITTVLPYNLDAWDGYPVEREILQTSFAGKNVVVLAGDTHNAWESKITTNSGVQTATEFATSSVTSPGFEALFGTDAQVINGFQQGIQLLVDDLDYLDASQRGFMKVTFTPSSATSEWIFVSNILAEVFSENTERTSTVNA